MGFILKGCAVGSVLILKILADTGGTLFLEGSRIFNLLALVLSVLGLFLTFFGLLIALIQIRAARSAAEQARDASNETARRFQAFYVAVQIAKIAMEAKEIILHLRADNVSAAAECAVRVREAAAYARFHGEAKRLQPEQHWQKLMDQVGQLHDRLERLARSRRRSQAATLSCMETAGAVVERINSLAGTAAERAQPDQEQK